jgi:PAS domain S-box-containing protein
MPKIPQQAASEALTRKPIDSIVPGGVTTLFAVFSMTVCLGLYILVDRHQAEMREASLLRTALAATTNMTKFRSFYSQEVVGRLSGSDVIVTHDYKNQPNAVPLPATMTIEFGKFLESSGGETTFRLLSELPFAQRAGRELDHFEIDAIRELQKDPSRPFYRYQIIEGRRHLRLAQGVIMEASCVTCHNSHPDSPYTDWQVGDLRGIQEVILPVTTATPAHAHSDISFRNIVLFVILAFFVALVSIFGLARRNRLAFADIEQLATLERERAGDIHESKEQVEEAYARLRAVVDNVAEAIITIDEQGIIETANPATQQVFGYPVEDLIGRNVACLMSQPDAQRHDNYIKRYCETGQATIIGIGREVIGLHRDGHEIPVDLSISEVHLDGRRLFTGIVRDISERKAAERALKQSEEEARKLSLVAARTDNAVMITDAKGQTEWVNEGFTRMTGYSLEEAVGKTPAKLLQHDDVDVEAVERIRRALKAGEGFHEELLNYSRDNKPYWVSIDAQPIFDEDGQIQQFIAIERDVTERRLREQELRDAILKSAEASEAKSRFLAMMSHEVRTPLNGVIGALGLLRDTDLNEIQRKYADTSRTSAESLLIIINDILDYSKMEAGKLDLETTTFDIAELVYSVTDTFSLRCEENGITLLGELAPSVPDRVIGDPARTRQVLVNLVGNAMKFTHDGEICVSVERDSLDDQHVSLKFRVDDTGSGIEPEHQAQLFDEFWSGDPSANGGVVGTGLGLAISKRLVEMMGGEIGVESTPGKGSSFWFRIPFGAASADAPTSKAADAKNVPQQLSGRILLAEDNPTNQMIVQTMLHKLGLSVDVVGNGIEAVDALKTRPYDVVLMDIAMPDMGGIEATHLIRELDPARARIPLIALTAHAMRGDREKFLAEGLDDYLEKPVTQAALAVCLSNWLGK